MCKAVIKKLNHAFVLYPSSTVYLVDGCPCCSLRDNSTCLDGEKQLDYCKKKKKSYFNYSLHFLKSVSKSNPTKAILWKVYIPWEHHSIGKLNITSDVENKERTILGNQREFGLSLHLGLLWWERTKGEKKEEMQTHLCRFGHIDGSEDHVWFLLPSYQVLSINYIFS